MPMSDFIQIALYFVLVAGAGMALAPYLHRVYGGSEKVPGLGRIVGPLERSFYRLAGVDAKAEQGWQRYALALLAFNLTGFVLLYGILRLQHLLPLNPAGLGPMSAPLAFNTAISFVSNTNWQAYGGESTLSPFSQMVGLAMQNFVSAATGMAVAVALMRAFARQSVNGIGNFWVDLTRGTLYVLLPLSIVLALLLAWQGVPQTLAAIEPAQTLEGVQQNLAMGPAASQIAIKQLGTNGGGFFSINSAHPFENPTPLSNLLQMLAILAIPAAFPLLFGRIVGDRRQGWAIFAAMGLMFAAGFAALYFAEAAGSPVLASLGIDPGASMEGKEVRFGLANSTLWAAATTAVSNGSVNAMHDSLMPLAGMVAMLNIMLGEVIFGGVGAGFYGMMLFVLLAVFVAGLMVGRTPEYLGKKIEAREIKLAMVALLVTPIGILGGAALGAVLPQALASLQDAGPHGLSEILYAYSSATGNNGSAFGGFGADTPYHNTALGLCMLFGRYLVIVPLLAIAGSLVAKKTVPASAGTMSTHGPLFVGLLIGIVLVVGGLTFFPALALGPIADHLTLYAGKLF